MNAFTGFSDEFLPLFDSDKEPQFPKPDCIEPVNPSAAAKADINERIPELRRRVLNALQRHSLGLTDEELQAYLRMEPNTERPRRRELVQGGFVRDSGRRRLLKSGKMGTVWEAKQ